MAPLRPGRGATRGALVAIVVGVCMVHAAGWWAWRVAPAQLGHRPAQLAPGWQVRMVARSASRSLDDAVLPAAGQAPPPAMDPAHPRVPETLAEKPPTTTTSSLMPEAVWHPTAFRAADELDEAPTPETGWWLDEAWLQQQGRTRLTIALWVSAQGRIVQWRLLHAEPPGDWTTIALARLSETPMRPGQWRGQPQAAHLVIEIASDDESYR